ncbi:multiple monosaccharide ABC transporter substrate-binding protein [Methylobacterium fujisawaense]|uniref:multiple monosaccharide ABC transporter substrate-binding protein n=1 Tax=Methylobacterium fujisawaense TaxID=107400 RepID=UPI00313DC1EB
MRSGPSILSAALLGALAVTSTQAAGSDPIGVAMPTKSSQRWIDDGNNIVRLLKSKGYKPDLQYADDDIPTQLAQIENMLTKGAKILVIASIDGTTLSDVLTKAHERGVKVIAYDRLIKGTPNVDYYATFDNYKVGVQQATSIVDALGLREGKGPFNIELFGGSPDDNNAYFFYDGALSVLKPYLDSKKLVVRSGQFGMDKVSILRWDPATAQARMDNLLSAYYGTAHLDAVLSPYDGISTAILSSVKSVGYGTGGVTLPVVSGQDAELQSVKSIIAGEQTATIFKDTRDLAKVTVAMIDAIEAGQQPEVNDVKIYNNGKKIVPSHLLTPVIVTKANWKSALVDTGYYTLDQLK